jgi:hypothetical protein
MVSHACASCGKPLGAASRRFAPALGMWVATCPRCGFAARWALAEARAGVRAWARLRALNLRLGIAFTFGQAAGGLLFLTIPLLVSGELRMRANGDGPWTWLATPFAAMVAIAAVGAGISATALAPGRGVLARVAAAWMACLGPVVLLLAGLVGGAELADGVGYSPSRLAERIGAGLVGILVAFLLSIPASLLATTLYAPFGRLARRRHAAAVRLSAAIERTPSPQKPSSQTPSSSASSSADRADTAIPSDTG